MIIGLCAVHNEKSLRTIFVRRQNADACYEKTFRKKYKEKNKTPYREQVDWLV